MQTVSDNSVHILFSCTVYVGVCSQDGEFSFVCLPTILCCRTGVHMEKNM